MTAEQIARVKWLSARYQFVDATEKTKVAEEIVDITAVDLAPEATALVASVESDKLPTTRNSYGRYYQFLGAVPSGIFRVAMVKALVDAGAGPGLQDACRVLGS